MKTTFMQSKETVNRNWYVIDAKDIPLGRVASKAATILRGKHKVTYTPHVDCGDYVIIVNADKVALTGNKLEGKIYYDHSRYVGGLRERTAKEMRENYPVEMVERAVKGMLPHNRLGRAMYKKLFVYAGEDHKHQAQKPVQIMAKEKRSFYGTGRRKGSVAKVTLTPGTGKITVNGRDVNEYMPYDVLVMDLKQPLVVTGNEKTFDVNADVFGGGFSGQTGAIRLGITRALLVYDEANEANEDSYRKILKANGFITRDPRVKERKKYGLKGARRAPQFSKR